MRRLQIGIGLLLLAPLAGCHIFPGQQSRAPEPAIATAGNSTEQIVAALNANADRIQSVECNQVDLDCSKGLQSLGLQGKLVCQKPKNFRMAAYFGGSQMVDLGSNDQEFWFWISKAEPPYQYHCSYADFDGGRARLQLPFQPQWVMEALGMGHYDATQCRAVVRGAEVDLIQQVRGPDGQTLQKITVLNRSMANQVQIVGHKLADARGNLVCAALVRQLQQDPTSGAILPKKVQLLWPAERVKMTMTLDRTVINRQMSQEEVVARFTRRVMPDVPTYDLARGPETPYGQVQRTNARGFGR